MSGTASGGGQVPEWLATHPSPENRNERIQKELDTETAGEKIWVVRLRHGDVEDIKKLLIIAPPESAKTTWLLAYLGAHVAFYPEWPRIMAAVTGNVAAKRSQSLRLLVESAEFQATFPDTKRAIGMQWTQTEWSVAPHHSLPRPGRRHAADGPTAR